MKRQEAKTVWVAELLVNYFHLKESCALNNYLSQLEISSLDLLNPEAANKFLNGFIKSNNKASEALNNLCKLYKINEPRKKDILDLILVCFRPGAPSYFFNQVRKISQLTNWRDTEHTDLAKAVHLCLTGERDKKLSVTQVDDALELSLQSLERETLPSPTAAATARRGVETVSAAAGEEKASMPLVDALSEAQKIEDLSQEIFILRQKQIALLEEKEALFHQNQALGFKEQSAQEEAKALREGLAATNHTIGIQAEEIDLLKSQLETRLEMIESEHRTIQELQTRLTAVEKEKATLSEEKKALEENLTDTLQKRKTLGDEFRELTTDLGEIQERHSSLQEEFTLVTNENDTLKAENASLKKRLREQHQKLKHQIQALTASGDHQLQDITRLKEQLQAANTEKEQLKATKSKLTQRLKEAREWKSQNAATSEQLAEKTQALESLTEHHALLNGQHETLSRTLEQTQKEYSALVTLQKTLEQNVKRVGEDHIKKLNELIEGIRAQQEILGRRESQLSTASNETTIDEDLKSQTLLLHTRITLLENHRATWQALMEEPENLPLFLKAMFENNCKDYELIKEYEEEYKILKDQVMLFKESNLKKYIDSAATLSWQAFGKCLFPIVKNLSFLLSRQRKHLREDIRKLFSSTPDSLVTRFGELSSEENLQGIIWQAMIEGMKEEHFSENEARFAKWKKTIPNFNVLARLPSMKQTFELHQIRKKFAHALAGGEITFTPETFTSEIHDEILAAIFQEAHQKGISLINELEIEKMQEQVSHRPFSSTLAFASNQSLFSEGEDASAAYSSESKNEQSLEGDQEQASHRPRASSTLVFDHTQTNSSDDDSLPRPFPDSPVSKQDAHTPA